MLEVWCHGDSNRNGTGWRYYGLQRRLRPFYLIHLGYLSANLGAPERTGSVILHNTRLAWLFITTCTFVKRMFVKQNLTQQQTHTHARTHTSTYALTHFLKKHVVNDFVCRVPWRCKDSLSRPRLRRSFAHTGARALVCRHYNRGFHSYPNSPRAAAR